jgi:uncharacterized membrane protein YfcA
MSYLIFIILVITAFLTSLISAVFGLAGGTILFAVLTWVMSAKEAIPIHSSVQLVSNLGRIGAYFKWIKWSVVAWFSLLTLPGAYLGALFYNWFDSQLLELWVGIFILLTLVIPAQSQANTSQWMFVLLGFLSGFLGMIVAVTGPLIASFFVMNSLSKEKMIATKSFCQGITQSVKLLAFVTVTEFRFSEVSWLLFTLFLATMLGVYCGKELIKKISDKTYNSLNNKLLAIIAISMIFKTLFMIWQ